MNSVSQGTRRLFETRLPDGRVVEAFFDGRRSVIAPGHLEGVWGGKPPARVVSPRHTAQA